MSDQSKNPFESLPLIQHIRELRRITGGSLSVGWMFDDPAFFLYGLMKWFKPELVIQTGHLWGKSALIAMEAQNDGFLAEGMRLEDERENADRVVEEFVDKNTPQWTRPPKVISIDPFSKNIPNQQAGVEYLKKLYGEGRFEFSPLRSIDFFERESERIKREYHTSRILGIVDGDHSWAGALYDMEYLKNLGAQMIIVDDTIWLPHLGRAVREFAARNPRYQLLNLTLYTGTAIFWKKLFRAGPPKVKSLGYTGHEIAYVIGGMPLWRFFRWLRRRMRVLGI